MNAATILNTIGHFKMISLLDIVRFLHVDVKQIFRYCTNGIAEFESEMLCLCCRWGKITRSYVRNSG